MTTETQLAAILLRASHKFGKVEDFKNKNNGEFLLAIKRKEPVFLDKPYMTITARIYGIDENGVSAVDFYHGHYDLNEAQALHQTNS